MLLQSSSLDVWEGCAGYVTTLSVFKKMPKVNKKNIKMMHEGSIYITLSHVNLQHNIKTSFHKNNSVGLVLTILQINDRVLDMSVFEHFPTVLG